jgi:hypothetical protein
MAKVVPKAELDEEAEQFKFSEDGDRLLGELVTVSFVKSNFGDKKKYPLLEVRDDAGKLWEHHAAQAALVSQFKRLRPQPGERISITFKGEKTSNTGRSYKDFSLRVARETPAVVDYDELGGGGGGQFSDGYDDEPPDDYGDDYEGR